LKDHKEDIKRYVEGSVLFVSTEGTVALYCTRQWLLVYVAIERASFAFTVLIGCLSLDRTWMAAVLFIFAHTPV
jgi:hypothetical protein